MVYVSVIIPCFNHGLFVEEAINSVVNQSGDYDYEIIVVNDGSHEVETLATLKRLTDKHNTTVINQENSGLGNARNTGIKNARGKYILPLDSDNKLLKPYLDEAIRILEEDDSIDIIYGNARYFGDKEGKWMNHRSDKQKMLFQNHIDACAIFRKKVWEKIGGYAEDMPYMGCEDWNFWLKAINENQRFHFLEKDCFLYRYRNDSMIRNIPEDFLEKIFVYNVKTVPKLYLKMLAEGYHKDHNVFYGGLIRRLTKMTLNGLKLYNYNRAIKKNIIQEGK